MSEDGCCSFTEVYEIRKEKVRIFLKIAIKQSLFQPYFFFGDKIN